MCYPQLLGFWETRRDKERKSVQRKAPMRKSTNLYIRLGMLKEVLLAVTLNMLFFP
jgi:hypothetical protein